MRGLFRYVFDFGDNWEHVIQIEKVLEADPKVKYPRCVKGSRAGPPEDCGGPWGYAELIEALTGKKVSDLMHQLRPLAPGQVGTVAPGATERPPVKAPPEIPGSPAPAKAKT